MAMPASPTSTKSGASPSLLLFKFDARQSHILLPSPAFPERRHRGLARRLVPVRRRAVLVVAKGERPHPRHASWHSGRLHDPANDHAISEHIVIVFAPLTGQARTRRALEDQRACHLTFGL